MFHFRQTERGCIGYTVGRDGVITIVRPNDPGNPVIQSVPLSVRRSRTTPLPVVGVTDGPLIYPED